MSPDRSPRHLRCLQFLLLWLPGLCGAVEPGASGLFETLRDRVFQVSALISHAEIDQLIGDSRIGRIGDMPGAEAAVAAALQGEAPPKGPVLAVVKGREE